MNIKVLFLTLAFFAAVVSAGKSGSSLSEKITICHVPYGNAAAAHAITIDRAAWKIPDATGTSSQDKAGCYSDRGSADRAGGNVAKHCPGGHGGDFEVTPSRPCPPTTNENDCANIRDICRANAEARDNAGTLTEEGNTECDKSSVKKISICHVPPGRPDKTLSLSIGCAGWKTKCSDSPGFHCPGGHGGDYAGLTCSGVALDTSYDTEVCGESLVICAKSGSSKVTKRIAPCFWRTDVSNCASDEYGPECGDTIGACPAPPLNCISGQATVGAGGAVCTCRDGAIQTGACVPQADGSFDCTSVCQYCDPNVNCRSHGSCHPTTGRCLCATGFGGPSCIPIVPEYPNLSGCTSPFADGFYQFNVISLFGGNLKSSDIEGSAIFGGVLKARDYTIGGKADGSGCTVNSNGYCPSGADVPGVPSLVSSSVSGSVKVCGGYAYLAEGANGYIPDTFSTCSAVLSKPTTNSYYESLDIQAIQARKLATSLVSDTLPSVDIANVKGESEINLNGNGQAYQNFNIRCNVVEKLRQINVIENSNSVADPYYVFSFTGDCSSVTLDKVGFSATITENSARNLWNFGSIKKVILSRTELPGLLLAPYADVSTSQSAINGQVIVGTLSGSAQVRNTAFVGCAKTTLTCQVTCSDGATPDPNTCLCPCSTPCSGASVPVPGQCGNCYLPDDCPLGYQNSGDTCVACAAPAAGAVFIPSIIPCATIPAATGPLAQRPFFTAQDFSVFVLSGGFVGRNNHVGGRIAARGDVTLLNFLVADEIGAPATECSTAAIVSGGRISFTNGQYATGALSAVGTIETTAVAGCATPLAATTSSYFDDTGSCLRSFSEKLNNFGTTGSSGFQKGDKNVFRFTGTNGAKNPEVFSIASDAFSAGYWALESVAEGSTIVINIEGGGSFANLDMSEFENFSTHTIFNFADDGDVTVYGVAVQGSILAPQSDVVASNGRILGHLVANTVAPPVSNGIYVQWLGGFTGSLGAGFTPC